MVVGVPLVALENNGYKLLAVDVSLLIVAPETIPVRAEPSPKYLVAVTAPVEGLYWSLVELTFSPVIVPLVASVNVM